jgi:hypothetical protein
MLAKPSGASSLFLSAAGYQSETPGVLTVNTSFVPALDLTLRWVKINDHTNAGGWFFHAKLPIFAVHLSVDAKICS